jgi:hypothetical protein
MDNNKDSGSNLAFWIPGGALVLSLVVSTFALQREPFIETRPVGGQFEAQLPIDARLWQDPFDAIERYRKLKDSKGNPVSDPCLHSLAPVPTGAETEPEIMVAIVGGGAYADEVELRRRIRYAVLAGLKSSRMVPEDEKHIGCLKWDEATVSSDVPYESFVANPFDPPTDIEEVPRPEARTLLFWLKEEALGTDPLDRLNALRIRLDCEITKPDGCGLQPVRGDITRRIKVIGPRSSYMLQQMYRQEAEARRRPRDSSWTLLTRHIEIYSPLATAERSMLMEGIHQPTGKEKTDNPDALQLLRTVSDDGTMAKLLLEELQLRRVSPVQGIQCAEAAAKRINTTCPMLQWQKSNRIAVISEWDSFYSRALIESLKAKVIQLAHVGEGDEQQKMNPLERQTVDQWILPFGYLRGLDGRLPEDPPPKNKPQTEQDKTQPDLGSMEKADGNSQLDYLRRLADHIASVDLAQRDEGSDGIGAIGILGQDTYDKLLLLQALKSRMPNKVYFSTDLDARMLQQGQARITRNLVLAAPYGLTLTRALQQDVPPFRESLQSAVFIAVLAAQSPQSLEAKRWKFDYSKSTLLSPSIYEVGTHGFIPLASQLESQRPTDCGSGNLSEKGNRIRPQDIMALRCLQDPSPKPYPPSRGLRSSLRQALAFFLAGPLSLSLIVLASIVGWWRSNQDIPARSRPRWVHRIPLALYAVAAISAWVAIRYWRVEFLWVAFALIVIGATCSSRSKPKLGQVGPGAATSRTGTAAPALYVTIPLVLFVLLLLWAYQSRDALTEQGLGEPIFLFEGISAWPTAVLRLLAAVISVAALAWGWYKLRINRVEIETAFHIKRDPTRLRRQWLRRLHHAHKPDLAHWWQTFGEILHHIFVPLSPLHDQQECPRLAKRLARFADRENRVPRYLEPFWQEHCLCGTFWARLLRAVLNSWVFLVVTSVLFVIWPMESMPARGFSSVWLLSWLLPTITFQVLVLWVVDANWLLNRFIRRLSNDFSIWPLAVRLEYKHIFKCRHHPCIDDWLDLNLIAKRTAAVNRLIYAPTLVMLILIASRSTLFDNWATPPSIVILFALNGLILLFSALSLRRAAEKARNVALARIDQYLLQTPAQDDQQRQELDKFKMIRERMVALRTGAFSRYSEEPVIRALLVSLTGLGGSVIVDALNFAAF